MRLLLTVHQFFPGHTAGTEILTLETARELRRRGHEVSVLSGEPSVVPFDDGGFDTYEYDGIPVIRFQHFAPQAGGETNTTRSEYNNWVIASHLRRLIRRQRPDLVRDPRRRASVAQAHRGGARHVGAPAAAIGGVAA